MAPYRGAGFDFLGLRGGNSTMDNALFFIQNGWKNIWKQKTIWIFSLFTLFSLSSLNDSIKQISNLLIWTPIVLFAGLCSVISFIGVPFAAYSFSIGNEVKVKEAFAAIKKNFWRAIVGWSCLGVFMLIPFFILLLILAKNLSQILGISDVVNLISLPFILFAAVGPFMMFGMFANDWGFWRSVKHALNLVFENFPFLAILGVILSFIRWAFTVAIGMLVVFFQSGFDISSFNTFTYLFPAQALSDNLVFAILLTIGNLIYMPLSASVFALAYQETSETENELGVEPDIP